MAKVSEVIERLEQLVAEFGDLPVMVDNEYGTGCILDARHDIYRVERAPGFLFEMGRPECIIIEGDVQERK